MGGGVLHVSQNVEENIGLVLVLSGTKWGPVHLCSSLEYARTFLEIQNETIGLILIDFDSFGKNSFVMLGQIQEKYPHIAISIMTQTPEMLEGKLTYFPTCKVLVGPILDRSRIINALS